MLTSLRTEDSSDPVVTCADAAPVESASTPPPTRRRRSSRQRKVIHLSRATRDILTRQMLGDHRGIVVTPGWVDEILNDIEAGEAGTMSPPTNDALELRGFLHRKRVYPPGGPKSLMVMCPRCQRHSPHHAVEPTDQPGRVEPEPAHLPGRVGSLCADCVEVIKPPLPDWMRRVEEYGEPGDGLQMVERLRLITFRRVNDPAAEDFHARYELVGEAKEAADWLRMEKRLARRIRDLESDQRLADEITAYRAGSWTPEDDPNEVYRHRRRGKRRRRR